MERRIISDIVKVYPDMLKVVIYHNSYSLPKTRSARIRSASHSSESSSDRSIRRTRQLISDIIACNRFDLWCTFTFNCQKCPVPCDNKPCTCLRENCRRFDPNICKLRISSWLHRQKVNDKDFTYIIVPEFHKNGAIHFHAFIKHCNARLSDTGKVSNGKKVYRFTNYTLGFSHVIDISDQNTDSHNKIASYMQKYIKKGMPMFHGRKRYFVSQNLNRPETIVNGIAHLGLSSVVRGHKPDYIDDNLEIQYHPYHGLDLYDTHPQSSFSILSSIAVLHKSHHRSSYTPAHDQVV